MCGHPFGGNMLSVLSFFTKQENSIYLSHKTVPSLKGLSDCKINIHNLSVILFRCMCLKYLLIRVTICNSRNGQRLSCKLMSKIYDPSISFKLFKYFCSLIRLIAFWFMTFFLAFYVKWFMWDFFLQLSVVSWQHFNTS